VAIGEAFVLESEGARIPRKFLMPPEVPAEIERFDKALGHAIEEMERLHQKAVRKLGDAPEVADIFRMHMSLLRDPKLRERIQALISNKHFTPEYAVSQGLRRVIKQLETAGAPYIVQRRKDIYDLERWLLNALLGDRREDLRHLTERVIIVAHDLTPSQTIGLDRDKIQAFVTDAGGRTSHTAILARTLSIPAVVGLGSITSEVSGGDTLVVDGGEGLVVIQPDPPAREKYERLAKSRAMTGVRVAQEFCALPAVTTDGAQINLYANIEFPEEAATITQFGAQGIGLYRTEFLYHATDSMPDEKAHFDAYMEVVRHLKGETITIRTLDLGADKFPTGLLEQNPFLGCRSIRLMLRDRQTFRTQLRAILRASAFGKIRMMFPMVCALEELLQAKEIVAEVMQELEKQGTPYDRDMKIGIMIEVPSAALIADRLAREADFFSIGTNDLIQYTLAVDRNNETVAHLFSPGNPAVLRLIKETIDAAHARQIPCSMCGEMAGDVLYTMLLIGLGMRELSMGPKVIPEVKRIIRAVSSTVAREVAEEALRLGSAPEISAFLEQKTRELLPDVF